MKAIIFLNGDPPSDGEIARAAASGALTVCADGAYGYLRGKLRPDVIIGDFDSLDREPAEEGIEVVRYPAEKDFSDGDLCVRYVAERASEVDIYGAFGGRADMAYANISLLYYLFTRGVKGRLLGGGTSVTLEKGCFSLRVGVGATVSLEPLLAKAHILQSKGLKYPPDGLTLDRLYAQGVSNEAVEEEISVTTENELLVFIRTT